MDRASQTSTSADPCHGREELAGASTTVAVDGSHQELWNIVREMNETWTRGDPDNLARYFRPNTAPDAAARGFGRDDRAACIEARKKFRLATRIHSWREEAPSIQIIGVYAVVSYFYESSVELAGELVCLTGRGMYFLVQDSGKWCVVGDHFSPFATSLN